MRYMAGESTKLHARRHNFGLPAGTLKKNMENFQKTIDIHTKIVYICVVIVWYCPIGGN